jgi:DNA anti-recombination protein RmuC
MERKMWTDERLDERFDAIDKRFDEVDRRFDGVDRRLDSLDSRLASLQRTLVQAVIGMTSVMSAGFIAMAVAMAT